MQASPPWLRVSPAATRQEAGCYYSGSTLSSQQPATPCSGHNGEPNPCSRWCWCSQYLDRPRRHYPHHKRLSPTHTAAARPGRTEQPAGWQQLRSSSYRRQPGRPAPSQLAPIAAGCTFVGPVCPVAPQGTGFPWRQQACLTAHHTCWRWGPWRQAGPFPECSSRGTGGNPATDGWRDAVTQSLLTRCRCDC